MSAKYQCPECGSNMLRIETMTTVTVRFTDDGDEEVLNVGDTHYDYDKHTHTTCTGCKLSGPLHEFDPND